jgi:hypothetical protein
LNILYSSSFLSTYDTGHISLSIPYFTIIFVIILVAFSKSLEAQVVILFTPKNTSSAALHQSNDTTSSKNFALELRYKSSFGIIHVTHKACHLRTIEIFSTGSALGKK